MSCCQSTIDVRNIHLGVWLKAISGLRQNSPFGPLPVLRSWCSVTWFTHTTGSEINVPMLWSLSFLSFEMKGLFPSPVGRRQRVSIHMDRRRRRKTSCVPITLTQLRQINALCFSVHNNRKWRLGWVIRLWKQKRCGPVADSDRLRGGGNKYCKERVPAIHSGVPAHRLYPRGHCITFSPLEGQPRYHFITFSPLERHLRYHFIPFSPLEIN